MGVRTVRCAANLDEAGEGQVNTDEALTEPENTINTIFICINFFLCMCVCVFGFCCVDKNNYHMTTDTVGLTGLTDAAGAADLACSSQEEAFELVRIKVFLDDGYPWRYMDYNTYCKKGYLQCIKYCHEHGRPWPPETTMWAAYYKSLQILKYCHEHGCPWHHETMYCAAQSNNWEIVKYCHVHGCEWTSFATYFAAQHNNFEMLKYCHEHGCDWDEHTTRWAAKNNNLDMLVYCHENCCPDDWVACSWAAHFGHVDILEYLYSQCSPSCDFSDSKIHEDSKEFLRIYGDAWRSGRFDVPLHETKPAKA